MIDAAFAELQPLTSVKTACALLGKSRATLYRTKNPPPPAPGKPEDKPRAPHPASLSQDERRAVLDVLDRLQDEIVRRYRTGEATVDSLLP